MGKNTHYVKEHIPLEHKELFAVMMKSTFDSVFFKDKECRFLCQRCAITAPERTGIKRCIWQNRF